MTEVEEFEAERKAAELAARKANDAELTALAAKRRLQPKRTAVVAFGRFEPPTTGHARLIDFLRQEAIRRNAVPIVFPSVGSLKLSGISGKPFDTRNPLPFREKVRFLRQLFPGLAVSANEKVRTPFDALLGLSQMGFDAVWFVVGSDRTQEFEKFAAYIKPNGLRGGRNIILKQFGVLTVTGPRDPNVAGVLGMSGTKLRKAALENDWQTFRPGIPTKNERLARQIYDSVRRHMGLSESTNRKPAFLLFGTSPTAAKELRESFDRLIAPSHPGVPRYDVSEGSYADIRQLHRTLKQRGFGPTIYVKESVLPRTISESWLKQQSTYGQLRAGLGKDLIVLTHGPAEMVTHAEMVFEVAAAPKRKEATEVDRLKISQAQEILLAKKRQSDQLLQAKQRELQKKSREDQAKLTAPKKGA